MGEEGRQDKGAAPAFAGFPDFQANVTSVPLQFFTVVLPYASRGCVRLVGYMMRQILGWVDAHGQPSPPRLQFTYRQLMAEARVSRDAMAGALREALDKHCLRCVSPPRPDRPGQPAQSGRYELCWDQTGPYTDVPAEFRGFYFPEAAVLTVDEGGQPVKRAKAARKNIPNAFFDDLLRREPLSVIRTVGALLFYSIQWGPGGERKASVRKSITELSRLARLSRRHVHQAVREAVRRGYLTCLEPGHFDSRCPAASSAALYGVRWSQTASAPPRLLPTVSPEPASVELPPSPNGNAPVSVSAPPAPRDRSEKVHEAPVGKGIRNRSEKVHEDRSEKVPSTSIKTISIKTTAAAEPASPESTPSAAAAAVGSSVAQLLQAGFDASTARLLADQYPAPVIAQQIAWLPLRQARSSRLGLLRRAIEGDWPKPEPATRVLSEDERLGDQFARYYYAGYHGQDGEPAVDPSATDIPAATRFVQRLLALEPEAGLVPQWGRRLGRLVRAKHQGDAKAKPFLTSALTLYGEELVRGFHQARTRRRADRQRQARAEHHHASQPAYNDYLRTTERIYQEQYPARYAEFLRQRQQARDFARQTLRPESSALLSSLDGQASRLYAFAECFRQDPDHPVLTFWQWDRRYNPQPFRFPDDERPGNPP